MQKIINETRDRLLPWLDPSSGSTVSHLNNEKASHALYGNLESRAARLISKIPDQNYGKLSKMVPIAWL